MKHAFGFLAGPKYCDYILKNISKFPNIKIIGCGDSKLVYNSRSFIENDYQVDIDNNDNFILDKGIELKYIKLNEEGMIIEFECFTPEETEIINNILNSERQYHPIYGYYKRSADALFINQGIYYRAYTYNGDGYISELKQLWSNLINLSGETVECRWYTLY